MLARYLRRSAAPVRYALDPAHALALRNYLHLASRAHELPLTARLTGLSGMHPAAADMLHGVTEHGDPDALAMLHDLHESVTGRQSGGFAAGTAQENPHAHQTETLSRLLQAVHGPHAIPRDQLVGAMGDPLAMGRFGQGDDAYLPLFHQIWRQHGPDVMLPYTQRRGASVWRNGQNASYGGYETSGHANLMLNMIHGVLRDIYGLHGEQLNAVLGPHRHAVSQAMDLMQGRRQPRSIPLGIAAGYDAMHGVESDPFIGQIPTARTEAQAQRSHLANLLRGTVLPMLLGHGDAHAG